MIKLKSKVPTIPLLVIALSVTIGFIILLNSNDSQDVQYEWFEECREDFNLINEFVLENFTPLSNDDFTIFLIEQKGEITALESDKKRLDLSKELKAAFRRIRPLYKGRDFSMICVSSSRIDFSGLGNRAFVFSRDGKKPKYFYSKDDGINFNIANLGGGWFFLMHYIR